MTRDIHRPLFGMTLVGTIAAGALALGVAAAGAPAAAQGIDLASNNPDQPIEVFADDGIEWEQKGGILIASGNAKAVRGNVTVLGDTLRAYYEKDKKGGTRLSRLDAEGDVKITSPNQTITGNTGVYDMKKGILVMRGDNVRVVSGNDVVTADQQMEYYEQKRMAVARGNARAVHEGQSVSAQVLVAYFNKDEDGKTRVYKVNGFEDVTIVTERDQVRANKGVYEVEKGVATLEGDVKITSERGQFAGQRAEIDLNTGISKLLTEDGTKSKEPPADGAGSGQKPKKKRIHGIILPKK